LTYEQIIGDLKRKSYKPIYFLCGEEEYFIDHISDYIEQNVLGEAEKEFNQTILYGLETDILTVIAEAKRYPMMSEYNVVIVKEAQNLKQLDKLISYVENPSPTTILVLNYKHKKADGRSTISKALKSKAVYFESKKLYENQLFAWLENFVTSHGYKLQPKATAMLLENIGTDLNRLNNELKKLFINLQKGEEINPDIIENNIGFSKEYNAFELNNALGTKNVFKANKIIHHFGQNPKEYSLFRILPTVYRFFIQVLIYHRVKNENSRAISSRVGVNPFFLKDIERASKHYSIKKIAKIITALRKADMHSKGIGALNMNNDAILKELVFEILH